LSLGDYHAVVAPGDLLLYARRMGKERVFVALNFGDEPAAVAFSGGRLEGTVLVSTEGDRDGEPVRGSIDLRGSEGVLIDLAPEAVLPEPLQ
jgi:hypothetical protein